MARVWTGGWEMNGQHVGVVSTGSPTIQGTTKRSGDYALQITSLASGTRKAVFAEVTSAAVFAARYWRMNLRIGTLPSAENVIWFLTNGNAFTSTRLVYLTLDSGGLLRLYDEDGLIGGASPALSVNPWYCFEALVDLSAGSGATTHTLAARIDGTNFASASDRALSAGLRSVCWGGNLAAEAQTTGNWYFDDEALNDTSGTAQNGYPGDGGVVLLRPSGAGDNAQWTRAGADSGANWDQCDEIPPNDATDYVTSNTLNQIDDYALTDTPAEVLSGSTINVVHVVARHRGSINSDTNASVVTRIKKAASGTVSETGTALNPNSTTWGWRRTNPQTILDHTLYADPDGAAWTKATLDTAQAGIRLSATDTNATDVSGVYVLAEYTNAAQGGGSSAGRNLSLLGVG